MVNLTFPLFLMMKIIGMSQRLVNRFFCRGMFSSVIDLSQERAGLEDPDQNTP